LRPIRIFKAESFRLAALFALVFLALTAALIGTVLWIVAGTERQMLIAANDTDISTVTNGLRAEGLDEAIEVVQQTLGRPAATAGFAHRITAESYMVIEEASGKVLAGNLPFVQCRPDIFTVALPAVGGRHHPRTVLGRCAGLTSTTVVFVGRDTFAMYATRERILHAFAWVSLGTCVFSILGGLFLGRRFMARVDAVTQTCERVIAGKFNERIPTRGRDDEWDRLARAINEMLDRISMLLENLQQVSSDIAHDLRTPLTRLRNRLEAARERPPGIELYPAVITRALDDTDQLLSMFSALLRISQIESGTRVQTFTPVSLSDVLHRLFEIYLPVAEDCAHWLSANLTSGVTVRGDQELLTQLFSNLIENAIRHTPNGTRIQIALELLGGEALASVIDDGAGVAPEDRDKVTRRFYRGTASRTAEGHGLGLALAAAIAQLHNARLELRDAGPGLRVNIVFPQ